MLNWKIPYWLEKKPEGNKLQDNGFMKKSVKIQKIGPTSPEKFPQAIEMPVKEKLQCSVKVQK